MRRVKPHDKTFQLKGAADRDGSMILRTLRSQHAARALPPELLVKLHAFCTEGDEMLCDLVADAVALHLDACGGAEPIHEY